MNLIRGGGRTWLWTVVWSLSLSAALAIPSRLPRPCTNLQPIDLLARALEYQRYLPSGTDITIDRAHRIHAISFSPDTGTLQGVNFPSNRVFLNCEYFPEEFSILVTLKARLNMKGNQYILSLVQERVHNIRLAIRITRFKVFFDYSSSGGHVVKKSSPSFATEIADGEWHTFVITVTGNDVGLTVDCRPPYFTYLDRTFPAYLDTTGTKFHIGNKRRRKEQFTGQLHQLVLLPGADASTMVCPSLNPQLARMDLPSPFPKDLVPQHNNAPDHQSDAHMKVEMGDDSVCTNGDVGRMWFDTKSGSMKLCDGLGWIAVADAGNSRIDYLDVHQDVYTPANTIDIETFYIEGEGLFMATANHDARLDKELESSIFKWTNGEFVVHQNIKTYGAQEWEHFVIDGQTFLAVANYGGTSGMETNSRVYRWEPKLKRFALHQEMVTFNARDWEAFEIDGEHYLVVANHARGLDHNIESVIFHWERAGDYFVPYQTIPTKAAYDWEAFTIGPYHFLAVANAYNGVSTKVDSVIYVWQYGRFLPLQFVETMGCTDWEYMNIGKEHFLVAANAFNHGPHALDSSYRYSINSTIYKLNVQKQRFEEFQNILTHSATDWESFRVGRDNYLVVANSYDDGESNDVDSVVYRWQGVEKFKPVHNIPTTSCADWEFFQMHGESFLVYANAKGRVSKVLRIRTY
ncbi:thrombospondin-type laminin G domain and EAR repeat-containing protein-like [Branchiostoma floridae x Branchiostoma belcheri]